VSEFTREQYFAMHFSHAALFMAGAAAHVVTSYKVAEKDYPR
jgi:hypothetical protein